MVRVFWGGKPATQVCRHDFVIMRALITLPAIRPSCYKALHGHPVKPPDHGHELPVQ